MNESFFQRIKEGIQDMCYIWVKEIRSSITDEGVLIFCILVPLLYPLLYSWAYTNEVTREVPVAVVDFSKSQLSRQFIRSVDASPGTKVTYHVNSLDDARELVARQVVHGILYFPADFSNKLYRGQQSHVGVYCDMSLMLTYKAIYQSTQEVASMLNTKLQLQQAGGYTNRDDEITAQPLAVDEVQIFNSTGGYGNALIPGVLMMIIQQTLLLGIGLAAGTARENNRYKDLVPISRHYNGIFRIVMGKSMAYFMLYAVIGAYLSLIVPRLFGYSSLVSGSALVGLLVPYILACIFFGMALSCMVRYRENVILLVVFTSIPLIFMTGISWPQHNIPGIWQGVAYLFPSTFGVRGFLRINGMGATLADIKTEYQVLWVQVLAYFLLTCLVYRYQIIHTRRHALERIARLKQKAKEAIERKDKLAGEKSE